MVVQYSYIWAARVTLKRAGHVWLGSNPVLWCHPRHFRFATKADAELSDSMRVNPGHPSNAGASPCRIPLEFLAQASGGEPWNKGKLIGAKPPLRPKHVWAIRAKLQVDGKLGSGVVTVEAGTTLLGKGTVGGIVDKGGTVSPGDSPGRLTSTGYATAWALTNYLGERHRSNFLAYVRDVSELAPLRRNLLPRGESAGTTAPAAPVRMGEGSCKQHRASSSSSGWRSRLRCGGIADPAHWW